MHCEVTCAALEAGKHVMTEARMARTASEARQMLAASEARPELVTQIVPSPFAFFCTDYVRRLIDDGFLGDLRELVVIGANDQFQDVQAPLHWRQDREIRASTCWRWAFFTRRTEVDTRFNPGLRPGRDLRTRTARRPGNDP
ncbi:MAG: hypothetical protein CM1200mP2_50810 [Planctomycetaceae bacterium]|nr:MAG: hypothetical protein CM1200mP2_50810 [Planctomycetaceae bacterium]